VLRNVPHFANVNIVAKEVGIPDPQSGWKTFCFCCSWTFPILQNTTTKRYWCDVEH